MKHEDYTIGWVCALPLEAAAAYGMLDERHDPLSSPLHDSNNYTFGRIGSHNVVIACLPSGVMGKVSAATVATQMLSAFPALRAALMVGIGGGVPSEGRDIRLGDVVVSKPGATSGGVIQYDFGKTVQEGRFDRTGSLNRPPNIFLTALARLEAEHMMGNHHISTHLSKMNQKFPKMATQFTSPGPMNDSLYNHSYDHQLGSNTCLECDANELVRREPRTTNEVVIHYGLIASGDQVMKHGATRERLRKELDILCFEMEAAGLMDNFPCLVIRGICDYSDSHKNKRWQPYAAGTAAAYAKELLEIIPRAQVMDTKPATEITGFQSVSLDRRQCTEVDKSVKNASGYIAISGMLNPSSQQKMTARIAIRYALASVPYNMHEIKLGSLVPKKKQPNQDAIGPTRVLRDGSDFSWRHQKNFNYLQPLQKNVSSFLTQLFSDSATTRTPEGEFRSKEGRVYELTQPRELFNEMCREKIMRDWLMKAHDDGYSIHLIVGYRTLLNATRADIVNKLERVASEADVSGARDSKDNPDLIKDPKASASVSFKQKEGESFEIPGERIFAICFRHVNFRWSRSKDANAAYLAKDNVWLATPVRRGDGDTDAVIEVSLAEDIGASDSVSVNNGLQQEEYYIPGDEDESQDSDDDDNDERERKNE